MTSSRLARMLGALALGWLEHNSCDVLLLDIQMPRLKGTEALALWPKDGPQVVFCTAHAQHAVEALNQTLGVNRSRWDAPIRRLAIGLALVVGVGFSIVPLAVLVGVIS